MGSGRTRCEGLDHSAQAIAECSRVPRRSFGPHREFAQCSRIGIAVATNLLSPLAPRRSIGLRGARSDAFIFGIVWFTRSGLNQACAYDVLVFFRILSGLLVHRRLHMRVSPHKAGTYWPSPSSPSAQRVLPKVRQISDLLVWNASDESAQIVIQWSWQQLDDELTGHLSLAWAASILVSSVIPVEGPVRRRPESLHCMAVLLVTLSIARLRRAMQSRHPRRWACRVLRALPPGWLGSVAQPGHPLRQALVDVIAGRYPTVSSCMGAAGGVSLVYCLFSETGWYLGKTNVRRESTVVCVQCGFQSRMWEHLRRLLRPKSSEGRRRRYQPLRRSLATVGRLPCIVCESEPLAYAMEAAVIRMEAPTCNALDKQHMGSKPTRLVHKSGIRSRPSSWRRVRARPWDSVWPRIQPWFALRAQDDREFPELVGVNSQDDGFTCLYRRHQADRQQRPREEGPVWPWNVMHSSVFLAYLASTKPTVLLPCWRRHALADFLFHASKV